MSFIGSVQFELLLFSCAVLLFVYTERGLRLITLYADWDDDKPDIVWVQSTRLSAVILLLQGIFSHEVFSYILSTFLILLPLAVIFFQYSWGYWSASISSVKTLMESVSNHLLGCTLKTVVEKSLFIHWLPILMTGLLILDDAPGKVESDAVLETFCVLSSLIGIIYSIHRERVAFPE